MIPIETVDAADPDAPNRTIRRMRRVDPLRALNLAEREWAAAERLRREHDIAYHGINEGNGLSARVDDQPWLRRSFADVQLDALRNMARVSSGLVMPPAEWDVAKLVILDWETLRQTAETLRVRPETVARRLRAALAALSDFYG